VFCMVMEWIIHDEGTRKQHMDKMLPFINFGRMKTHYLLDVIPYISQQFEVPIRDQIMKKYEKALEIKYGGERRLARMEQFSEVNRPIINNANNLAIKWDFTDVSKWNINDRITSPPNFANGYEFMLIVVVEPLHDVPDPPNYPINTYYTLGGYICCESKFIPQTHYLSLRVSIEITTQRDVRKIALNTEVGFCGSKKIFGSKLTYDNENWDTILSGETSILRNDTLSIGASIDFQE